MEEQIFFFSEETDFELLNQEAVAAWLGGLISAAGAELESISYIFCSDDYLLEINKEHLDHDYYTDIITFPLHDEGAPIMSDIFVSVDRVADNAEQLGISFKDELHRVMAHGILHLLGHDDHDPEKVLLMRAAEENALSQRDF
ncbi:MAG: rRNA maturation RNase YbeY [Bacteroidia bacterium]|nr:rRNA maturation RNase YbeY [Bacteroidia bacterium]